MTAPRRWRPGPGQLVLLLPGVPDPRPVRARQARTSRRPTPRPQSPGELQGAAPTSRQVRTLTLTVEHTPDNRYRLTLPKVPAWAAVVSNPQQLTAAFRGAFTEIQIAAYSDWKRVTYDGDVPEARRAQHARPKRSKPMKNRRDIHPPTEWKELADGRWKSPSGMLYQRDCQVVVRVRQKLFRLGLSLDPAGIDQLAERRRRTAS